MKRLLQINVSSNWGSTGRIAEECNKAAANNGMLCATVYGRYHNPSAFETYRVGCTLNSLLHYAETRLFCNEGGSSRLATKRLIKWIDGWHPDIVHIHNIHDHWLNYQMLFEYLNTKDIKIIWTFHDFWAITGLCCHFIPNKCEKWKTECGNCPISKRSKLTLQDRTNKMFLSKKELFTSNKNLHIVAVSEWVGELTRQSFLRDKEIRVIPNGVDINVFKPTSGFWHQTIKENTFVIMAVSSQWNSNGKGLPDYKSMSKILKEDEVIVLVGVPDKVIADLPKNIIGIKRTNDQTELAALYTRANVVTSFSSAETFGLTIIEGYACGTPAVVYDNTAPPSLITPETGFVVENRNYVAAYSAIQTIKEKGKQYYSDACIRLVKEKYDKKECFEKYAELYEEITQYNQKKD